MIEGGTSRPLSRVSGPDIWGLKGSGSAGIKKSSEKSIFDFSELFGNLGLLSQIRVITWAEIKGATVLIVNILF